ncbi:hypothetical protein [Actinoplanes derwentensis]|uniref:Uncharacterized protein n=1 Tax=Actinoplanes derwentensis TaxID=113562 RepID=A0A1H1TRB7_9ACTN|nr:hypothetical protein [Actinoplanes derwentensis]GID85109.1 hypothetical protein Ade03nite_40330 [Actinoplanes derwentensis]SDS62684.1 hypothetical protein SAMN04489716_1216 [Actinoplanes derwentensis]
MYYLVAVIAEAGMLRDRVDRMEHGAVAMLRDGMALVPVSQALFEELTGSEHHGLFSERMPPAFDRVLAEWSTHGPLAFVQADFFGGDGDQTATVWRDGAPAWGPVHDRRFDGPREQWPINAALAQLGLRSAGWTYSSNPTLAVDLFDQIGLGMERDMTDWLDHARSGATPAPYEDLVRELKRRETEEALAGIRPALNGREIMTLLNIPSGPLVGAATRRLKELHLERGPLPHEVAEAELHTWAHEQGIA